MKQIKFSIMFLILLLVFPCLSAHAENASGLPDKPYSISEALAYRPSSDEYAGLIYSPWQETSEFDGIFRNGYYVIRTRDVLENYTYTLIKAINLSESFGVTVIDKNEDEEVLGKTSVWADLGYTYFGSELGSDTAFGTYYKGYRYDSCSSTTVVENNDTNIVYRLFIAQVFTVTLHNEDGSVYYQENVKYGKGTTAETYPAKASVEDTDKTTSYVFTGWITADGTPVDVSFISSDLDLYPDYEEVVDYHTITVRFHFNNEANTIETVTGTKGNMAEPEPYKEEIEDEKGTYYYEFIGWSDAFGNVISVQQLASDADVYAKYEEKYNETYVAPEIPEELPEFEEAEEIEVVNEQDETVNVEQGILYKWINDEEAPVVARTIASTISRNKDTIGTVSKVVVPVTIIAIVLQVFGGMSLTQFIIFVYLYFKKHKRYVQGAWLLGTPDIRYTNRYGRRLEVTKDETGHYVFKNKKGKTYEYVDAGKELRQLSACRITNADLKRHLRDSEVYTEFNRDVRFIYNDAKANNVERSNRWSFSHITNFVGETAFRISEGGKQIVYELNDGGQNL